MRKQREANRNWDNMNSDGRKRIDDKTDKNWPQKTLRKFLGCFVFSRVFCTKKYNNQI